MREIGILGLLLVAANLLMTYLGLKKMIFFTKYCLRVENILRYKDYKRLITSGFLHVSWTHFFLNMVTLICFSPLLEIHLGEIKFLVIYFLSLVGSNLFAVHLNRNFPSYNAVGASGAITGIIFASIAIFPGLEIAPWGILYLPSWLYGIGYISYTIYGIIKKRDSIGHEAHLGGGLIGLTIAILFVPSSIYINYIPISLIVVPSLLFIVIYVWKPDLASLKNIFQKSAVSKGNTPLKKVIVKKSNTSGVYTGDTLGAGQGQASGIVDNNIPTRE